MCVEAHLEKYSSYLRVLLYSILYPGPVDLTSQYYRFVFREKFISKDNKLLIYSTEEDINEMLDAHATILRNKTWPRLSSIGSIIFITTKASPETKKSTALE